MCRSPSATSPLSSRSRRSPGEASRPHRTVAGVVARRRRELAATDADCFRIGGRAPALRRSAGPVALVGASDWALRPDRVETTVAYIGALGGLLADLGYDVYAVSSLPDIDAHPAFVGWVGGQESATEHDQLVALETRGLSIGGGIDELGMWAAIEPNGPPNSIEFSRAALHEIRRLTEGDAAQVNERGEGASTVSSTVQGGTGAHAVGRPNHGQSRNPSSKAQSGTGWDSTNKRSSDS